MKQDKVVIFDKIVECVCFVYLFIFPIFWERNRTEFIIFTIIFFLEKIFFVLYKKKDIKQRKLILSLIGSVLIIIIALAKLFKLF